MKNLVPKKEQWQKWSLPSIGTYVGLDIFPQTQIPRKLDDNDKLISNIWLFKLRKDSEIDKLTECEIVELN